jgi:hypothetical protein
MSHAALAGRIVDGAGVHEGIESDDGRLVA